MSMKREVIMINGCGDIIMPTDIANVWMSEPELVELFGVIAPTLRAAIRAVYKSGVLKEYEVQKYVRLENGYYTDVFGFPMVAALAFRINTFGADRCAMPYLKGCTCEMKKQASSFRWVSIIWIRLIIRRKAY